MCRSGSAGDGGLNLKRSGLPGALRLMKPGDWVVIGAALALSAVVAVLVWTDGERAAGVARVYVDSWLVAELPLDTDGEYVLGEGDWQNTVEISGGRARMSSADCADGYCVRQGWIQYDGETIICLPHRVVIELEAARESGLDAIAS